MSPHAREDLVLALCCVAQFMTILDVSIVNVALPSIGQDVGGDAVTLQWIVNAYTLALAGFLVLGGRLGDVVGLRAALVGGLALFATSSVVAGLAQSDAAVITARATQGLGGALVAPATLAILLRTFGEGAARNRALGWWGAMSGAGGASGALLGGILVEYGSWRWIFLINVPIALVAAVAALRFVAEGREGTAGRERFDVAGALSVTLGLVALTAAIVGTDAHGWSSSRTVLLASVGFGLLAVFVLIESRIAASPLVPLRVFTSRTLTATTVVVVCMGGSALAMWYLATLYLQEVLGYSPLQTGLVFFPMSGAIVFCARIASRLSSAVGAAPVLTAGMVCLGAGMLWFAGAPQDGRYLTDILGPSLVCAAGVGFTFVSMTISGTAGVAPSEVGLVSGILNMARQAGGALGIALLTALAANSNAETVRPDVLAAGFGTAFEGGAAIAGTGLLACVVLLRDRPAVAA